jgi:Ser/Thr protein kinase RdoA (MazF antagonist)
MPLTVLPAYGLNDAALKAEPVGNGLIHRTWKIISPDKEYILQQVNHRVFKEPETIAGNIGLLAAYLKQYYPEYSFIAPLADMSGNVLVYREGKGYFRLFPFVRGSFTINVVETPQQAQEAALQFGLFTRLLSRFETRQLKNTIPFFHDLTLRYQQFMTALENGNKRRLAAAASLIEKLDASADIVAEFSRIKSNPDFKLRVTHHDTKINNVLFDGNGKGICIIDLDTVMPGYFISDVGDMMRTCLSPVSEEEKDFSKIRVREEFYTAIVQGYYSQMKNELTATEKKSFFYAGKFMIYMQALRFLTDYLNDDSYYGAGYPDHNLVRAGNQATLLERLMDKETVLGALQLP